jgi:hypothetical protein
MELDDDVGGFEGGLRGVRAWVGEGGVAIWAVKESPRSVHSRSIHRSRSYQNENS